MGNEGDLFKKSPLTPLFQRGHLVHYEMMIGETFMDDDTKNVLS
jgi:hypothetical protein